MRRVVFLVLGLVLLLLSSDAALAQCSMCKAVLSSSTDASFIRGYNIGVLVLLLPPVTIFCSIFIVLRRHKGQFDKD
ncbi:MAG TPA: hypothetical protein VLA93_04140 [Pyrinomonadaceae bacterium]|nr:hypothetical protein [Pyrinomonadaceae bacterium]